MGENNREYEIVMSLYRDGRITEQQRDKLLSALEADGSDGEVKPEPGAKKSGKTEVKKVVFLTRGVENPYDSSVLATAVSNVEGVKRVAADVKRSRITVKGRFDVDAVIAAAKSAGFSVKPIGIDYEEADSEVDGVMDSLDKDMQDLEDELSNLENEFKKDVSDGDRAAEKKSDDRDGKYYSGFDYTDDGEDNGPFYKKFREFSEKVAEATNKGIDSVKRWGAKLGESVSNAFATYEGDTVIKCKPVKSDVPYEKLRISVKYAGANSVAAYTYDCTDTEALKSKMRPFMSEQTFSQLCEKIDEKFVGTFKYVDSSEVLKIKVAPPDTDED
ncbi:MAG: hypothetical protein NC184_05405 [Roseburia sp.]|nr:hypothetical protein [Roseburia sp.]